MGYRLGIDLGTTYTSAAVYTSSWPTMVGLGNRAMQVPSVLFLKPDGEFLVGEAAERRGAAEPERLTREFKRRLGDQVPILVAGSPQSPQALQARLLTWVVQQVTQRQGAAPDHITLTYPANWGPYKRDLFRQTIAMADVTAADTCTEPEAAATLYAARNVMADGDCIAVYDLGGGTFDSAILRKTADGFDLLGRPEGIEHLGGIDFDEAVFHHVLDSLGDAVHELPESPALDAGLVRLRRDCVEAKEALSSDTDTVVPVTLPGLSTSARLVRDEFEQMIRPTIADTIGAMRRVMRSADLQPADLTAIVLTGGSSRIPLVSQQITMAFDRPLALDTHPKHDVAMGAAIHGVRMPARSSAPKAAKKAVPSTPPPAPPLKRQPERAAPTPSRDVAKRPAEASTVPPAPPEPPEDTPTATEGTPADPAPSPPLPPATTPKVPEPEPEGSSRSGPARHRPLVLIPLAVVLVVGIAVVIVKFVGGDSGAPNACTGGRSTSAVTSASTGGPSTSLVTPSTSPPTTSSPVLDDQLPRDTMLVMTRGDGQSSLFQYTLGADRPVPLNLPHIAEDQSFTFPTISPTRDKFVYLTAPSSEAPLTPCIGTFPVGHTDPLFQEGSPCTSSFRPGFDPSGDKLAIVCRKGDDPEWHLYVMTLTTHKMDEISTVSNTQIKLLPTGDPTWVNGTDFVFLARIGTGKSKRMYLADSQDPKSPPTLIDEPNPSHSDTRPDWSSGHLLFLRTENVDDAGRNVDDGRIVVKQELSPNVTPAPIQPQDDNKLDLIKSASWSPDGKSIVFTRANKAGGWDLWTMRADGFDPKQVDWPDELADPWHVAWSAR